MAGRRKWGCNKHCFIWWYRDGVMFIGCGHCSTMSGKVVNPVGDQDLLQRQSERSLAGHQLTCGRPVR